MTRRPPSSQRSLTLQASQGASAEALDEAEAQRMPVLRSAEVLRGQRAVEILHAGVRDRLSVTSMGKLILTK